MNQLKNWVQLIGHLGFDPELKELDNNKMLTRFAIATNEGYRKKDGTYENQTQWHNVIAWGKTAELASRILTKGNHVALEGKLIHRTYEDKMGQTRYASEVQLMDFVKMDKAEVAKVK